MNHFHGIWLSSHPIFSAFIAFISFIFIHIIASENFPFSLLTSLSLLKGIVFVLDLSFSTSKFLMYLFLVFLDLSLIQSIFKCTALESSIIGMLGYLLHWIFISKNTLSTCHMLRNVLYNISYKDFNFTLT